MATPLHVSKLLHVPVQHPPVSAALDFRFDEKAHLYYLDGARLLGVTSVLNAVGLTDYAYIREQPEQPPTGFNQWRAYWLWRGSAVHSACSLIVQGWDQEVHDWLCQMDDAGLTELRGYVVAFTQFLADTGFEPLLSEERVFHRGLRYAGTVDLVGRWNKRLWVPDIKCTDAQIATSLQTAAYTLALPSLGETIGYVHADQHHDRFGLGLRKDGTYAKPQFYDSLEHTEDETTWLAALTVAQWRMDHYGVVNAAH